VESYYPSTTSAEHKKDVDSLELLPWTFTQSWRPRKTPRNIENMKTYKIAFTAIAVGLIGLLPQAIGAENKGKVGISMPTKSSLRWIADGNNMVAALKEKGFKPDLQYAEDEIPNQLAQIENMVTKGSKVLVIAAIDGTTLSDILQKAADSDIKVIAYDRLIRGTPNVDYYATFDNFQVGVLQAQSIEKELGLKEGKGPFNIELFGGSPDDNNAYFFYDGAMSVLQPYIDSKKLVVQSGQTGRHAALGWRSGPSSNGQSSLGPLHRQAR
jgi:putative multiple sugar transport system substrate-binding protein